MTETRIVPLVETSYNYGVNTGQWQYRQQTTINSEIEALERDGFEVELNQPNTSIIVMQRIRRKAK